jgi:predicted TPR repeat methyltransferase
MDCSTLFQTGTQAAKNGDFKQAIALLTRSLSENPAQPECAYNLAACYQSIDETAQAILYLQKAIEQNPHYVSALFTLGQFAQRQEEYTNAIQYYHRILSIDPEHALTHYHLGLLQLKKNPAQSYFHFKKAIPYEPFTAEAYYHLGVCEHQNKNLTQALYFYEQAIEINPLYFEAMYNIASIYQKKSDIQNAIVYYTKALKIKPDHQTVAFLLTCLQQKNTPEQAPRDYIESLFDHYADFFEEELVDQLNYKTPHQLFEIFINTTKNKENLESILDLGCGTGLSGLPFSKITKNLIGVDLSENMLKKAVLKNIYTELVKTDVCSALKNFIDQDLIIASDVFVYIGNLENVFRDSKQTLKKNGLFIFSVELLELDQNTVHHLDYKLDTSGRYQHHVGYIQTISEQYGYTILHFSKTMIRTQKGEPVLGGIFLLLNN